MVMSDGCLMGTPVGRGRVRLRLRCPAPAN
jgi:hypothetical protein